MLAPAQTRPNPAPAPFEPITTLIAAKLFLGGGDTIQSQFLLLSSRSLCGRSAVARGRGAFKGPTSATGKAGDEGEAGGQVQGKADHQGEGLDKRQESCSCHTKINPS